MNRTSVILAAGAALAASVTMAAAQNAAAPTAPATAAPVAPAAPAPETTAPAGVAPAAIAPAVPGTPVPPTVAPVTGEPPPAPAPAVTPSFDQPGWTGATRPAEVIAARQALMLEVEKFMRGIDTYAFGEPGDLVTLQQDAASVGQLMLALPHLFPPTTNLFDAAADTPQTLALSTVWENFEDFYNLAIQSSATATDASLLNDPEQFRQAGLAMRATCDACHAAYMRPFVQDTVHTEDLNFNFGAFGG